MTKSKHCIDCDYHNETRRDFYIDEDQRVWPCCFYSNETNLEENDNKLYKSLQDNPDWNKLSKNDIKSIVANEIYSQDIYIPGWKNNPTKVCILNCGSDYLPAKYNSVREKD